MKSIALLLAATFCFLYSHAQSTFGCTDPTACNFKSNATIDDGLCSFAGTPCDDGNPLTRYDRMDSDCQCTGFIIQTDCADEIFISEYVEGTNNNKAIELYNPTSQPVLLDGVYSMGRDRDGAGNPMLMNITGIIEPLSVRVFALDKRDPNGTGVDSPISPLLEAVADTFLNPIYVQSNSPMWYNGDDAFVLVKNGNQIIDIVGKIGEDPGGGWWQLGDPNTRWWTMNHTMVRKPEVLSGVTANPDVFDPSLEWDTLSVDDFSHLGWHEINCNPGCLGLNVDHTLSNPSCFAQNNGSIDIHVTGGSGNYIYQWSSQNSCPFFGATTEDLNNITACQYSVNVVDQDSGCEVSATITLDQPAILELTLDLSTYPGGTNVSCFNSNDGTISAIVTGGTPDPIAFAPYNYFYNWAVSCGNQQVFNPAEFGNDVNSPYLTNLPAGFYGVEITDANGCLAYTCFDLVAPDPILSPTTEIIGLSTFEPFSVQTYSVSQLSNVSYEWSVTGGNILQGQGSNFIQVQWANNSIGSINLVITTSNGCQTMLDFVVESALEVNENGNSFIQWSAFPNPASDMVTIQLTGTTKPIDYRLLDATGRIISLGKVSEGLNNLSISHLSSGIYTIELQPAFSTLHRQQLIVE